MMPSTNLNHRLLILMIIMMSVTSLIASNIFIPALPDIMQHFNINANQAQSMLSTFLWGIAFMQLFYGPLSDSLGRRQLLLAGLTLFALASVAIIYAENFRQVQILRIIQAIGACSGITLGRAIVADLFNKEDAGKIFLTIYPFIGMSPAIAPLIGGQLNKACGWQACFVFSMIFGIVLVVLILWKLPETLPLAQRHRLSFGQVAQAYRVLLTTPRFWHYTIIPCIAYAVYWSYIAESPFLMQTQGVPQYLFSYSYISLSVSYVLGNLLAHKLMQGTRSSDEILYLGYKISVIGGILLLLATVLLPHSFLACISAVSILTLGNGFLLPLGSSRAVTSIPGLAGAASGLMGALQIASAAGMTAYIGRFSQHQPGKFGTIVSGLVVTGFLVFRIMKVLIKNTKD